MSFFGFDASLPNSEKVNSKKKKPLDFDETYKGLGDYELEENDYLNNETFGANVELGTDFDFGHGDSTPVSNPDVPHRSYVAAASTGMNVPQENLDTTIDLKPMESLWGGSGHNNQQVMQQPIQPAEPQILSMEEIERQQRQLQMNPSMQQQGGYVMPPPGFMQQQGPPGNMNNQFPNQFPPQFVPPGMPNQPQFQQIPQDFHQQMYQPPNQQFHPQQMNVPPFQHPQAIEQQQQQQPRPNIQSPQEIQPNQAIQQQPNEAMKSPSVEQEAMKSSVQQQHLQSRLSPQQHRPRTSSMSRQQHQQQRREPPSAEEQKRLQIRHAKVEKILKHSGLMTPRDKDFITRYQLSQIVTEDPYNEDFYFQVYKIIQRGGVVGESNKGLIARAYLEHSGHRLGGRYKRADIALQRMQSQVEKAVTVAKERPHKNALEINDLDKNSEHGRDGVLGKISSTLNSKAPRRQLQIPLKSANSNDNSTSSLGSPIQGNNMMNAATSGALEEVTESLGNVDINAKSRVRRRSSYAFTSVDQNSVLSRSGGRKFVLRLIETVYGEVLELEANLRSGKKIDNNKLWDALHIDDEAYEVCPFVSMLSFDKGVKIMPRIFNFLNKEQKLKLLQIFFSELSHLNIIIISSYKTNPTPSESQLKQIDLFQTVFLKIIVSFLSNNSNFIEIMGLLLHLIKNNNVSFISTSKIGLNLITVLISRAALIRQDSNRSNILSSPEISTWNEIYDKLFTSLESKLSLIFPPKEYTNKIISITNDPQFLQDDTELNLCYYDQAYIWQFLASLALSGKLNHQRIIIDEVRDEIFGTITLAESLKSVNSNDSTYRREKLYQDLNLFLNVMGLVSRDGEITELK
ncbi:hypothetical protein KAFR_0F04290 [Kazachstania africana CBS 2517]|uniref:mRNA decay factor PAT1 domain-containing protein n=1 Tax=Kazachstania africana (strain ATCC 22294 / BCRC 22015 / CBS 2517 / CECT 1963 / NBRC 1671 / NRRL Y-8276) TaxID=1071382 RepID=H2AXC4_KAZAF|nr:hypothetical protein KAFR_0F04290 [Kazachstania africana CBS 2517]CCF59024.1 hypothetical protein KAFR_0F04290 [Kazachstania africana CBS 2517]